MIISPPLQNRCAESKSPYVRAHASNPTAWQQWTPEILALAKSTNRLLFVSIGYSACHWCHVMADESFADDRIAQLLNERFIPVKIDREERPDVDRVYMDFLQATTGGGGWPLNVFVTPDLEPIYGGTYWPRNALEAILGKIASAWEEQEDRCRRSAAQIAEQLREFAQEGKLGGDGSDATADQDELLEFDLLEEACRHHAARFDAACGGFGAAPKFPTPPNLSFLLRLGEWDGVVAGVVGDDQVVRARQMAVATLEHMARGGIKDQIGHGFARYSVTRDWTLPHFEKMLYDNAQLLPLYLDAWLITSSPLFLEMVHDIATYITTSPIRAESGGFMSSEDADSAPLAPSVGGDKEQAKHREGAYYVWSWDEFGRALDDERLLQMAARYWNVQREGNVAAAHDVQGELTEQNTLSVTCDVATLAHEFSVSSEDVSEVLGEASRRLLAWRERHRPRPNLDDKIVVAWNGLAIGGLARTAAALSSDGSDAAAAEKYLSAAIAAAAFIRSNLYDTQTKTLRRVYRDGPGSAPGLADDYAFLISGLVDLYQATSDDSLLSWADELQAAQLSLFGDSSRGGFYSTPADARDILVRSKDGMDAAEPSTNAVSAANLLKLGALLADDAYVELGAKTVAAFAVEAGQHPGLFGGVLCASVMARLGVRLIVIVSGGAGKTGATLPKRVRPGDVVVRLEKDTEQAWLCKRNPFIAAIDTTKAGAHVCEGRTCRIVEDVGSL